MRHQTGIIWILIAGIGLCLGCTEEKLLEEPVPDSPVEVHFFSSAVPTRAEVGAAAGTDTLVTGANVRIYAYRKKTGVTDTIAINNYTVKTGADKTQLLAPAASAEGSTASEMILPSGTFNFYAVSTNSEAEEVPAFPTANAVDGVPSSTNAIVAATNGIDYLYAQSPDQKITFGTETAEVPLKFEHAGTQVQLTIKFGESAHAGSNETAQSFNLAQVSIQATSESDAFMHLYDGQILLNNSTAGQPGSADDASLKAMTVVRSGTVASGSTIPANQIATYHLLPLATKAGQKMKIKIVIDNLVSGTTGAKTHTYTGELDASAGWLKGTSNQYTLTLSGTEIKFSTVTVKPWTTGTGGEVGGITDTTPPDSSNP